MLTEQYRELLTAYVDGEISGRQRRALHKLLRRSPEARKLLKEMQADSDEIRALPPARLDQDLSDSVLTLIAQRQIQIPRPRVTPPPVPVVAGPSRFFLALCCRRDGYAARRVGGLVPFLLPFFPVSPLIGSNRLAGQGGAPRPITRLTENPRS